MYILGQQPGIVSMMPGNPAGMMQGNSAGVVPNSAAGMMAGFPESMMQGNSSTVMQMNMGMSVQQQQQNVMGGMCGPATPTAQVSTTQPIITSSLPV